MSVSGIQSVQQALSATYVPSTRGVKEGAAKLLPSNTLQSDYVELSAAAQKKVAASKSLLEQAHTAQPGAQESPAGTEFYTRSDMTSLFSQWGSAAEGSEYDFNQDGVVDAEDLASLLARLGQAKPEKSQADESAYTRADIDGLYDAWNDGTDPSRGVEQRYDLDGDGRVNATDLAELLARLSGS